MIEIVSIRKNFVNSGRPVLDGISLKIEAGEFFSLLGPSGCGKTTLLRILAGLEKSDAGRILFQGRDISELPAQDRPFHMVFQRHALFPHLTVFENVAFGLRLQKRSREDIQNRVQESLRLVKMESFADRMPASLSGGQSQRVALARALACRPQVLLLDEPLSALDLKLRESMQIELRQLQKRLGITFIYVTHDQQEAFSMSDRVAVMAEGRFEQVSDPISLYLKPESLFSAQFIGAATSLPLLQVRSASPESQSPVEFEYQNQTLRGVAVGSSRRGTAYAVVRPECVLCEADPQRQLNRLAGTIRQSTFRGSWMEVQLETDAGHFMSLYRPLRGLSAALIAGQRIDVFFAPEDTQIFWRDV